MTCPNCGAELLYVRDMGYYCCTICNYLKERDNE